MEGPRARESPRQLLLVAAVALAASVAFWSPFLFGGALHNYDWGTHHWNYFDWVRASIAEHGTLPLFMNDAWITKNFLANAEAPSLGPLVWLLVALPTDAYAKLLVVVFGAAALAGGYLLLRDLGTSAAVAATGAALFAWNGFVTSHLGIGHHWAMGVLLLPGLVLLFRRGSGGSAGALVAAAVLNAFTIGGGQHQPFLWQNAVLAAYAVVRAIEERSATPLRSLLVLWALTLGVGAVKILPMWAEFAEYDPSERTVGLPLSLLLRSLSGAGQGPAFEAEPLGFAHGGGWWEYSIYIGPVALVFLLTGLPFARRCLAFVVIAAVFLVLAIDWPSALGFLDVWPRIQDLPLLRTQRSPSRFLVLALFAFTVMGAIGFERVLERGRASSQRGAALLSLGILLGVAGTLYSQSLPWQRAPHGAALVPHDHRPRPLRIGEPGRATAELVGFAPNRLVYRVDAEESARLVFPFRNGEGTREWRVDGLPDGALPGRNERGKLALELPPGEREVVMVYRPKYFHAGALVSAATLLALAGFFGWRFATSRR